jgi:hypothetical protein
MLQFCDRCIKFTIMSKSNQATLGIIYDLGKACKAHKLFLKVKTISSHFWTISGVDKWWQQDFHFKIKSIPPGLRPDSGSWSPHIGIRNHTRWTYHTWWDSSGRVIGPKQWPLPDKTQRTNIHPTGRTRTRNPSKRAAADPRLIRRDHWDQLNNFLIFTNFRLNDNSIITELRSARPSIFDFQKRRN